MQLTLGWMELIGGLIALLTASVVLVRETGRSPRAARRQSIRESLEILELLSAESPAKADLRESIDRRIIWLVHDEIDRRRSWTGIRDGCFLILLAAVEMVFLPALWPLWLLGVCVGAAAVFEAIPRKVRHDNGVRLIPQPSPPLQQSSDSASGSRG